MGHTGDSNAVYFGSDNGKLYKVDATSGTVLWSFQTGGPIRTMPILGNSNDVYFGSDDGNLYGLDISTGGALPGFPIQTGAEIRGTPQYDQGNAANEEYAEHHDHHDYLYFSSNDGKVYCVDIPW
jgi:outer membrane protein assembly factor BamB